MNEDVVREAVASLRPSLGADGFDLSVAAVTDTGTVEVILTAGADACLDCLVPDDTLAAILDRIVREREPGLERIVLTKAGFDALDH
jgi:Fe-S cluster biogenesis protein NfuA